MEKGRKAWFKIKKIITLSNSCNLLEKHFDYLVVPIILLRGEVWGVGNKFRDSDPFVRQATLVVLHCTTKISFINIRCRCSKGSESLNLLPTPQTSPIKYKKNPK
jgi:hypothetical protein